MTDKTYSLDLTLEELKTLENAIDTIDTKSASWGDQSNHKLLWKLRDKISVWHMFYKV